MSYAVYLRNKMKNLPVVIGPESGRDASDITWINTLRANKIKSATDTTEPLINTAQSIPVIQSYTAAQDYGLSASIPKDTYSFSTVVYKGGYKNQSCDSITLKNAASVMPDDRAVMYPSITIPCMSNYTLFNLRSISGLIAWFDAADAATLFGDELPFRTSYPVSRNANFSQLPTFASNAPVGGQVSYWVDKTGNYFATPPGNTTIFNGASMPLRQTSNSVLFRGFEMGIYPRLIDTPQGITITDIGSQGVSIFMVTGVDTLTTTSNILLDREDTGLQPFGPTFVNYQGTITYRADGQIGTNPNLPSPPGSEFLVIPGKLTNRASLYFDRNSSNANVYVNGGSIGTVQSASISPLLKYTTFGRYTPPSNSVTNLQTGTGYSMHEVIVIDRTITQAERQLIEGYLAQKWSLSLPATHPYYWKPVLTEELPTFMPTVPCKPGYCPGIKYTGPQQFDPFRGGTRPVFARGKVWTPSGAAFF